MRIYMEVDGVINAAGAVKMWGAESFDSVEYQGFTFCWSMAVVRRLLRLMMLDGDTVDGPWTEIVWVTNWEHEMPVISRMLGFGHIAGDERWLELPAGERSTVFDRAEAVLADLEQYPIPTSGAGKGGWVWLDAESDEVMSDSDYVRRLLAAGGPGRDKWGAFVPPVVDYLGITPELMAYIDSLLGVPLKFDGFDMGFGLEGKSGGEK